MTLQNCQSSSFNQSIIINHQHSQQDHYKNTWPYHILCALRNLTGIRLIARKEFYSMWKKFKEKRNNFLLKFFHNIFFSLWGRELMKTTITSTILKDSTSTISLLIIFAMVVDCSVVYKTSSWMKFFLKNIWQKGVHASRDVTFLPLSSGSQLLFANIANTTSTRMWRIKTLNGKKYEQKLVL